MELSFPLGRRGQPRKHRHLHYGNSSSSNIRGQHGRKWSVMSTKGFCRAAAALRRGPHVGLFHVGKGILCLLVLDTSPFRCLPIFVESPSGGCDIPYATNMNLYRERCGSNTTSSGSTTATCREDMSLGSASSVHSRPSEKTSLGGFPTLLFELVKLITPGHRGMHKNEAVSGDSSQMSDTSSFVT